MSRDLIAADRKVLNVESESRLGRRKVPVVQDYFTEWLQGCPTKEEKLARIYNGSCRRIKSEGELTQTVQTRS